MKHVRAVTEDCDVFVIAKYMPQRHMPSARGMIYINQNKVLSSSNRFLSFVLAFRRIQGRYSIGIWRLKSIVINMLHKFYVILSFMMSSNRHYQVINILNTLLSIV